MGTKEHDGQRRLLVALVLYPAAFAAIAAVPGGAPAARLVLVALLTLVVGGAVRRDWMYLVPVVGVGAWMLFGTTGSGCDGSCEDAPSSLALLGFLVVGGGSVLLMSLGDAVASLALRGQHGSAPRALTIPVLVLTGFTVLLAIGLGKATIAVVAVVFGAGIARALRTHRDNRA